MCCCWAALLYCACCVQRPSCVTGHLPEMIWQGYLALPWNMHIARWHSAAILSCSRFSPNPFHFFNVILLEVQAWCFWINFLEWLWISAAKLIHEFYCKNIHIARLFSHIYMRESKREKPPRRTELCEMFFSTCLPGSDQYVQLTNRKENKITS